MTNELREQDVVRRIHETGSEDPIGVLFRLHAAFYFIYRDVEEMDEWLAIANESLRDQRPVWFSYDYRGQRITHLEFVPKDPT